MFELIHNMKIIGNRKCAEMAMKIDISDAYDKVQWEFLEAMLLMLGFDKK